MMLSFIGFQPYAYRATSRPLSPPLRF